MAGATLIGARLRLDVAADDSPPPCGEGLGVGVGSCGTSVLHGTTPHPIPPPQGGRESMRLLFLNLAPMGRGHGAKIAPLRTLPGDSRRLKSTL